MTDRYTRTFESHEAGYVKGIPVLFEASSLLKDNKEDTEIAQLKFRCIGKPIKSMMVSLDVLDDQGTVLAEDHRFAYSELNVQRGEYFGTQTPIPLGKCEGKSLKVRILNAVLADGTELSNEADFLPVPSPEPLTDVLEENSLVQHRKIYGNNQTTVPLQFEDIWFCGCGAVNHDSENICHVCGKTLTELKEGTDPEYLSKETDYREADQLINENTADSLAKAAELLALIPDYKDSGEKAERINEQLKTMREIETAARLEAQKRSKKKTIILAGIGTAAAVVLLTVFFTVIRPKLLYAKAAEAMKAEDYTQAKDLLTKISDYNDASSLIEECERGITYQEGQDLLQKEDYKGAIDKFSSITSYKQSSKYLVSARSGYTKQLFNQKDYDAAYEQLSHLDSTVYTDEDLKKIIYSYAKSIMNGSDYEKALDIFTNLGDYLDSADLLMQTKFNYVSKHQDSQDQTTYSYITELIDAGYKDAKSLYNEIYAWKVSFVCLNTSPDDTTTNLSSVSKYDTFYVHFKLTGGPPGESTTWTFTSYWPDGGTISKESDGEWYSDSDIWVNGSYFKNPQVGATGTATVIIYIDGKEMCRKSFTLTN